MGDGRLVIGLRVQIVELAHALLKLSQLLDNKLALLIHGHLSLNLLTLHHQVLLVRLSELAGHLRLENCDNLLDACGPSSIVVLDGSGC